MMTVGLTGNVASGKSLVARIWAEASVPVISADDLAREVVRPGTDGLREVIDAFGAQVLKKDGTLDRDAVRRRVFDDARARHELEDILHPRILALRHAWLERMRGEDRELVVAEVPLLFEAHLQDDFDVTVVVHSPAEIRLQRLIDYRGLRRSEARAIMAAQGDPEAKLLSADEVLLNDGSPADLKARALELLERLRQRARRRALRHAKESHCS